MLYFTHDRIPTQPARCLVYRDRIGLVGMQALMRRHSAILPVHPSDRFDCSDRFVKNTRHLLTFGGVVLLHVVALWALQSGLLQRVGAMVVPVQLLSAELVAALPQPPQPAKPVQPPHPQQARSTQATPQAPSPSPAPLSVVPSESTPAPSPPANISATATPSAISPAISTAAAPNAAQAPTAAPASPRIELPSSDADYLNNPPPAYPSLSMRMGEQGRVVVRVLIDADGLPQKAELHTSSGFLRLDRAAIDTAMKWRYTPGKRSGVAEAMWFNVPIKFVIS